MNTPKFEEEREIVERFLRLLGYSDFSLRDPNAEQGLETGADVLAILDGRRYGIQVTMLHPDEGQSSTHKGSNQRRQEARFKNSLQTYATWGNAQPDARLEIPDRREV